MEQEKSREANEGETESKPEADSQQKADIAALEALLAGGGNAATALFSIVVSAIQSPETFGSDDVMITLKSFGMEHVIEEARVFNADMGEAGDVGDPEEDTDIEAMLDELDLG